MTITALKLVALITMTIDHIGKFIPDMPIWFRWLGRISAPIFIFCLAEALHHTSNQKKYVLRLYSMVWVNAVVEYAATIIYAHISGGHYIYISNSIFTTLVNTAIVIIISDELLHKKKCTHKIFAYLLYQILTFALAYFLLNIPYTTIKNYGCLSILPKYLVYNVSCNIIFSEGGLEWVFLGVLFYYYRRKVKYVYPVYVCFFSLLDIYCIPARIAIRLQYYGRNILYYIVKISAALFQYDVRFVSEPSFIKNYQWMMIFSLPFFMLYNGRYGRGFKKLFYIYYPVHIAILFLIGNIL